KIPITSPKLGTLEVCSLEADLDIAPGSVVSIVGGHVAKAVSSGNLALDLFIHLVDFFEAGWEQRQPTGHRGEPRELHALIRPAGARLMLKVSDNIDGEARWRHE